MNPFISIIMPVYNNERYLPKAVESILKQSFKDFELIIVDDGSTDNTPSIADSLAEKDSRINVIHQKNQWIYASFNNGIAMAVGEYIYIVNSDDRLRDGVLSSIADIALKYNPDIVWTKVLVHVCDEFQNITEYDIYRYDNLVTQDMIFYNQAEVRNNWHNFYKSKLAFNQANLYRTSIAKKHPFRNDVYGADQLFNISIANDIKSAYVYSLPVYDHFQYLSEKMNASVGKYYGYEHSMFDELYTKYTELFNSWGLLNSDTENVLASKRLADFTHELRSLLAKNCPFNTDEKIKCALKWVSDEIVYSCAEKTRRIEELESRFLSGCRELLIKETIDDASEYYFIFDLLNSLLCYEKDNEDFLKIHNAVYHDKNPLHIGECFYKKIMSGKKD